MLLTEGKASPHVTAGRPNTTSAPSSTAPSRQEDTERPASSESPHLQGGQDEDQLGNHSWPTMHDRLTRLDPLSEQEQHVKAPPPEPLPRQTDDLSRRSEQLVVLSYFRLAWLWQGADGIVRFESVEPAGLLEDAGELDDQVVRHARGADDGDQVRLEGGQVAQVEGLVGRLFLQR